MTETGGQKQMGKPSPTLSSSMLETALSSAALIVINFVSGILLARLLGPEGRGAYGALLFWAQFAVSFLHLSLFEAFVIRARSRDNDPAEALPLLLSIALILALGATLILAGMAQTGLIETGEAAFGAIAGFFSLFLVIGFLNQSIGAVERAKLSFRRLNVERVFAPSLFMLVAIVIYWLGEANVVTLLFAFALAKLPTFLYRAIRFRQRLFGKPDESLFRQVAALGPRLHLATGLLALASQADRIVVTSLWPASWIGYYFVAYAAVGAGMSLASQAMQIALLPHLAGLDEKTRRNAVERMIRGALLFGVAVAVPVWIVAPWLIPALYGPEFAPAANYAQWITVAMALSPCLWGVNVANRALERSRPGVEMGLISLAVFAAGYALTGFEEPKWLFVTMFVANLASIMRGILALSASGALRIGRPIVPGPADVRYIVQTVRFRLRRRR